MVNRIFFVDGIRLPCILLSLKQTKENSMKLRHLIEDTIALISILGGAYAALIIGHGFGL